MNQSRHAVAFCSKLSVEALEARQLRTAVTTITLNSPDPAGDPAFQTNGSSLDYNGAYTYLPNDQNSSGSSLSVAKVPVSKFTASVLAHYSGPRVDDAFQDFVIEGASDTALSSAAPADAGYAGGTFASKSVAVVLKYGATGTNVGIGFGIGGAAPTQFFATGIDSNNTDLLTLAVRYSNGKLRATYTDGVTVASTAIRVDLPALLGGQTAYVGLSGSTSSYTDPYTNVFTGFKDFAFSGEQSLAFTTPASARIVAGASTAKLSALATLTDGADLTYAWSVIKAPRGAAAPTFNHATGSSTLVAFRRSGTYRVRVTATDSSGASTFSNTSITVTPVATTLKVSPHARKIDVGTQVQFSGSVVDQFGRPMPTQPTLAFSIERGVGTIDPQTGLYTAPEEAGHVVILVTGGDMSGIAGATIVAS